MCECVVCCATIFDSESRDDNFCREVVPPTFRVFGRHRPEAKDHSDRANHAIVILRNQRSRVT
jgi:hypothetical protein